LISVLCPCGTGDGKAFSGSRLYVFIQGLPAGFYMIANNAYMLSEHLLMTYSSADKKENSKDAYNFYILQLCIQIEQSFGYLLINGRFSRSH